MGYDYHNIPVVILTGRDDDELATKSIIQGAQDYLVKGKFDSSILIRTINHAVERQKMSIELQKKKTELLSSKKLYSTILEQNPDGMMIITLEGLIVFVNKAVGELFGRDVPEMLGEVFGFPASGDTLSEIEISCKGKLRVAKMNTMQIEWLGERVFLAVFRDVSMRKQVENELAIMSLNMNTLVESITEGVIMFDKKNEIAVFNTPARKMLGFDKQTTIFTREFYERYPLLRHGSDVADCKNNTECHSVVKEITAGEENNKILSCEFTPVRNQGQVLGTSIVLRAEK